MKKTPKIAVFSRIHYDEGMIPESTLYCFENYYLKSLKEQTCKDFEIILIANNNNLDVLKAIIKRSGITNPVRFTTQNERIRYEHEIEVNLDSDDAVDVRHIKAIVDTWINLNSDLFLIVFTKYIKLDVSTGLRYSCVEPTKLNNGFPTNFYAVCQRGEKKYGCGMTSHNRMDTIISDVVIIDNICSTICVHSSNSITAIHHSDKLIK